MKIIRFTAHAEQKLLRLKEIGITKEKVIEIVKEPGKIENGYFGRKIAQSSISKDLVLRIVYEETSQEVLVITIYPGEKRRYQ
ncbi:MAG: DUF4258 domain-containing protein [bacterium (Candidatus Stahlbacteria) CG08_land_8_20_14_0_20_40_26]|nr:MAG: DUF4258 domain-containing protein [bacterium (Candidatus Stahlbacteria) CG23_combo_of_CG06-09_8_20_14_all_40_9]PIS25374.1 MAG: DUF4258 domain-containing protein [bacterium (Candidatus Stahlbacteria) CG08_land_8_20_14_0_20_40_26]